MDYNTLTVVNLKIKIDARRNGQQLPYNSKTRKAELVAWLIADDDRITAEKYETAQNAFEDAVASQPEKLRKTAFARIMTYGNDIGVSGLWASTKLTKRQKRSVRKNATRDLWRGRSDKAKGKNSYVSLSTPDVPRHSQP